MCRPSVMLLSKIYEAVSIISMSSQVSIYSGTIL